MSNLFHKDMKNNYENSRGTLFIYAYRTLYPFSLGYFPNQLRISLE